MNRPAKEKAAAELAEYYQTAADRRRAEKRTVANATDGATAEENQPQERNGDTRLIDFNGVPQTSTSQLPARSPHNTSWTLRPPRLVLNAAPATDQVPGAGDAGTAPPDHDLSDESISSHGQEVMGDFEDIDGTDGPEVLNKLSAVKIPWDDDIKYFFF